MSLSKVIETARGEQDRTENPAGSNLAEWKPVNGYETHAVEGYKEPSTMNRR